MCPAGESFRVWGSICAAQAAQVRAGGRKGCMMRAVGGPGSIYVVQVAQVVAGV